MKGERSRGYATMHTILEMGSYTFYKRLNLVPQKCLFSVFIITRAFSSNERNDALKRDFKVRHVDCYFLNRESGQMPSGARVGASVTNSA